MANSMAAGITNPVLLGGFPYYVHPLRKAICQHTRLQQSTPIPVTVIFSADGQLSDKYIAGEIRRYLAQDDVYSLHFAWWIVLQVAAGITPRAAIGRSPSHETGPKGTTLEFSIVSSTPTLLPPGPYFAYDNGIYEAWRLYPDHLDAFEIAVVPEATRSATR
ncbi:MAG: hypothetical protein LQ345_006601 [Seirophora villosa]|nr:MAG: hypothetical protein LQ345_006601 [Seirophora villosa]